VGMGIFEDGASLLCIEPAPRTALAQGGADVTVRISHFYWTYFRYACYCGQLACALLVWTRFSV